MKLLCITVGKGHDPLLEDAVRDYMQRMTRTATLEWRFISHSKHTGADGDRERATAEEAQAILGAINDRDVLIALDEKGTLQSTKDLSKMLEQHMNQGTHRLVFVIGGAYGLHKSVLDHVDAVISLSKLTFPHQLVRLILTEQLYRAFSIIKGEKYHHE